MPKSERGNKIDYTSCSSHKEMQGKCLFFARRITKSKTSLKINLQWSLDAASPLKMRLFLTVQMLQHIKPIILSTWKGPNKTGTKRNNAPAVPANGQWCKNKNDPPFLHRNHCKGHNHNTGGACSFSSKYSLCWASLERGAKRKLYV